MFKNLAGCSLTTALCTAIALFTPAAAGERLIMTAHVAGAPTALTVVAGSGKVERIDQTALRMTLSLQAKPAEAHGGFKILASNLSLQQEGTAEGRVETSQGNPPLAALALEKPFTFAIDARGPVAQNAVQICGSPSVGARGATMTVSVLWRVTTGRFNFRWVQANLERPSDGLLANPDFYADHEVQELELPVLVEVRCGESAVAHAGSTERPATVTSAKSANSFPPPAKVTKSAAKEDVVAARNAKPPVRAEPAAITPRVPANVSARAEAFVCEGGMAREISSQPVQHVCLCPGHTKRREKGANAFSCERKFGRRS